MKITSHEKNLFQQSRCNWPSFGKKETKKKMAAIMTSIVLLLTVKCNPMKREEGGADHFCQVYVINTHWWKNT